MVKRSRALNAMKIGKLLTKAYFISEKSFQNQRLDKPRLVENSTNMYLPTFNKDSLPRICIDFSYASKTSSNIPVYNIKVIFNDVAQIGQSSIYNAQATYKLVLYKYEFAEKPDQMIDVNFKRLYKINLKQVMLMDSLNLTSGLFLSGLKQGKYLVEVSA